MDYKTNEVLLKQATSWYARVRAPDISAAEQQNFAAWLALTPAHAEAYQAVVLTATRVTQQGQVDMRLRALADAALANSESAERAAPGSAIHGLAGCGAALKQNWRRAAVLIVCCGMAALLAAQFADRDLDAGAMASYANNTDHEQRIELSDGSVVHLDVASTVSVVMQVKSRQIELHKGRAYFDVAHDAARPFSVVAAGTRTIALGTRFEVSLLAPTINVTLAQGSVAVTDARAPDRWRELLTPGQQLQIQHHSAVRQIMAVNVAALGSWSEGRLVFDALPLAKALEEINRYATVKVHLGDTALGSIPIGGSFKAGGDSTEFVETLSAILPLRIVRAGANEIVLFQQYENSGS